MSTEDLSSDECVPPSPDKKKQSKLQCVMFSRNRKQSKEPESDSGDSSNTESLGSESSYDSSEPCTSSKARIQTKKTIATKKTVTASKPLKKRIKKAKPCPICGKKQKNVWRHLKHMHPTAKPLTTTKKISKKGYVVKVCPLKSCGKVVERLRDHLVRTHDYSKNSLRLKTLISKAKPVVEKKDNSSDSEAVIKQEPTEKGKKRKNKIIKQEPTQKCKKRKIIEISSEDDTPLKKIKTEKLKEIKKERVEIIISDSESDIAIPNVNPHFKLVDYTESESEGGKIYTCEPYQSENPLNSSCFPELRDSDSDSVSDVESDSETDTISTRERKHYTDNPVMEMFIQWLQDVPCLKPYRTALQHAKQSYMYWSFASTDLTFEDILEITCLNGWISSLLDSRTPGTLRSYLCSLRCFTDFLVEYEKIKHKDMKRLLRFREQINIISKKLRKRIRQRRTVIETRELQTMILPVDIQRFLASEASKANEQQLLRRPPMVVVPETYYTLRDYLIFRIMQANAQRPMALCNITREIVERAKLHDDGGAVLTIAEHKTSESGPVMLNLSPELFVMLNHFIELLTRIPDLPQNRRKPIFLTWTKTDKGDTFQQMSSSGVDKAIKRTWSKVPSDKHISATRIRKATSTAVRQACPASREALAKHMTHAPETADRYYYLQNQQVMARPVGDLINRVMNQAVTRVSKSVHWPKTLALPAAAGKPEKHVSDDESLSACTKEKHQEVGDDACTEEKHGNEQVQRDEDDACTEEKHGNEEVQRDEDDACTEEKHGNEEVQRDEDDACTEEKHGNEEVQRDEEFDIDLYQLQVPSPLVDNNLCQSEEEEDRSEHQHHHKRRSFSDEDSQLLLRLCESNISSGKVRKVDIMMQLQATDEGKVLILKLKDKFAGKNFWKIIVDRILAEKRRRRRRSMSKSERRGKRGDS